MAVALKRVNQVTDFVVYEVALSSRRKGVSLEEADKIKRAFADTHPTLKVPKGSEKLLVTTRPVNILPFSTYSPIGEKFFSKLPNYVHLTDARASFVEKRKYILQYLLKTYGKDVIVDVPFLEELIKNEHDFAQLKRKAFLLVRPDLSQMKELPL